MSQFVTQVETEDGREVDVTVEYNFTPPRAATYWEPREGGVEIEGIISPVPLTTRQRGMIEQECIDAAWDTYYEWRRG